MNRCLCCGKPLKNLNSNSEQRGWHASCVKSFFGVTKFPDIDISEKVLMQLAIENTNKGYTIPGVQKKMSLHLTQGHEPRLTLVNYPTGYILKPQTEEYNALPEMEYLVMRMAEATGIKTVPFGLLKLPSQDGTYAYITKRIDRKAGKRLAMEDFCQLDGRLTEDKYRGSYERCGKIVSKYSSAAGLDLAELYLRIVFSFVVGNSDMHLKNFSLIETDEGSREYVLSAAYDMLSTNVILPEDQEQMALTVNGKKHNIHRKDFMALAQSLGLVETSARKMIAKIVKMEERYIQLCKESFLPDSMKAEMEKLICERMDTLR